MGSLSEQEAPSRNHKEFPPPTSLHVPYFKRKEKVEGSELKGKEKAVLL